MISWPAARLLQLFSVTVVALAWFLPATASAVPAPEFAPGQVLVRFIEGTSAAERKSARNAAEVSVERVLPLPRLQLVTVEDGSSVATTIAELEADPAVAYAEPNYLVKASYIPNDEYFNDLWGLHNTGQTFSTHPPGQTGSGSVDADIDAPEAWDVELGDPQVKVAVVDTGIDYNHPDLENQIWQNPGETGSGKESNGIDDDGNGAIDDWRGYDVIGEDHESPAADNDPMDGHFHGTHVAGTVAAEGDNDEGVVGVAPGVTLVPVKALADTGSAYTAEIVAALEYAGRIGADVVNGSFGSYGSSQAEQDVIERYPNTLFAFAAGNESLDNDGEWSAFPCSYPSRNIICTASTTWTDSYSYFSNHGFTSVDLAAPGSAITSTKASVLDGQVEGDYLTIQGTSMASPHTAGAAALLKSHDPGASPLQIKSALMDGVDQITSWGPETVTNGRLNVATSLALLNPNVASTLVKVSGGRLQVVAGAGAANQITISGTAGALVIEDNGATVVAGGGCTAISSDTVECSDDASSINVVLGDQNDAFTNDSDLDSVVEGGSGDDSLTGGDADDELRAGIGTDVLVGGDGSDTASYSERTNAVNLSADSTANDGEASEGDSIANDIEVLEGGAASDTLTGSSVDNTLRGGAGADQLHGQGGDDALDGGTGADSLDGGSGVDLADYSRRIGGVSVSLDGVANDGEAGEGDSIAADVDGAKGGKGADTLVGNSGPGYFDGGKGNDSIDGGAGADEINGGPGIDFVDYSSRTVGINVTMDGSIGDGEVGENDNVGSDVENIAGGSGPDDLVGNGSDNSLRGNGGDDELSGLGGNDIVRYHTHTSGVTVTLDGVANDGSFGEADLVGTDIEDVAGSNSADVITGSSSTNRLVGNGGDDQLNGGDGDDVLQGGLGADELVGDAGTDRADYSDRDNSDPLFLTIDGNANDGSSGEGDTISTSVEDLLGGQSSDVLTGSNGANHLDASASNDAVYGLGGDDTIYVQGEGTGAGGCWLTGAEGDSGYGGDGNDVIVGGVGLNEVLDGGDGDDVLRPGPDPEEGAPSNCGWVDPSPDTLVGGNGNDTVSYEHSNMYTVEASLDGVRNDGISGNDLIETDVENLVGSLVADELTGDSGDNILDAGPGRDRIDGGLGSDELIGGTGNDELQAGDGVADDVNCGDGADAAVTDGVIDTVTSCETLNADIPTIEAVDNLIFYNSTASIEDQIWIKDATAALSATPVVRFEVEGAVIVGDGCLRISPGVVECERAGIDMAILTLGPGNDVVNSIGTLPLAAYGNAGIDQLLGGSGPDQLFGGEGDDPIWGRDGGDYLDGGSGADTLVGNDGYDSVSYGGRTEDLSISPGNNASDDGASGEHDFIQNDIESIFGGNGNDMYTAGAAGGTFAGMGGADTAYGSTGQDTIYGGAGDDELLGGANGDALFGNEGEDDIHGNDGDDQIDPGEDMDTITGDNGTDTVFYQSRTADLLLSIDGVANDGESGESDNIPNDIESIFGGEGNDLITGSSVGNFIHGMAGDDVILGEDGNDSLHGGDDNDVIEGSAGDDTLEGWDGDDLLRDSSTGPDVFQGGDGYDHVDYSDRTAPLSINVNGSFDDGQSGEGDFIGLGIERFTLGLAADTFVGSDNSEHVDGMGDDDVLSGNGGEDHLNGNTGEDDLDGGDDSDVLDGGFDSQPDVLDGAGGHDSAAYNSRTAAVNVSLDGVANDGQSGENDQVLTEAVQGGSGNDTLTGNSANNYLAGNDGNDTLIGGYGEDMVIGMAGDDTLRVRDGESTWDYVHCGTGTDNAHRDTGDSDDGECETLKTAPDTSITAGPAASSSTNDTTPTFEFTSDESPVTFYECRVDSGSWSACSSPHTTSALSEGEHTFDVRAVVDVSVDPTPASRTFTVDTTAPNTLIDSGPADGNYGSPNYTFNFSSSESGSTMQCSINSGSWTSCTSPYSNTIALGQQIEFRVRATDAAGNVDASPAVRTFTYVSPQLNVTNAAIPSSVPVSTEGTRDWVHWGLPNPANLTGNRKSGSTKTFISDATKLNGGTLSRVTSGVPSYSWSGGAPTSSSSGTTSAIYVGGAQNRGFRVTGEAVNSEIRTIKLYVGVRYATGKLTVSLSDGSVSNVVDTSVTSTSTTTNTHRVFTIAFRSSSPTATATIDWVQNDNSTSSTRRVLLEAATALPAS